MPPTSEGGTASSFLYRLSRQHPSRGPPILEESARSHEDENADDPRRAGGVRRAGWPCAAIRRRRRTSSSEELPRMGLPELGARNDLRTRRKRTTGSEIR